MASAASKYAHVWAPAPVTIVVAFMAINTVLLVLSGGSLSATWRHPVSSTDKLQVTPVYRLLQAAKDKVEAAQDLSQAQTGLFNQSHCTVTSQQLHGVLAAAAGFKTAVRVQEDMLSRERAPTVAAKLRQQLSHEWTAVLAPFSQATGSSNCSCRSVRLTPPFHTTSGPPHLKEKDTAQPSTALLLALGDWSQLGRMLRLYSLNLFSIWSYARMHGYGLELYIHDQPLPNDMPVFYVKVLGVHHLFNTLGYQHVLYLDLDTFTSPHSAPPLSLLYGEFPAASLLLQAEHNICAAAIMWRNTPEAAVLLQAWWDVGASGCCPTFPHDQTALKHMMLVYLANVTGQPWLYGPGMQRRFRLPPQPPAAVRAPANTAAFKAASKAIATYVSKEQGRATARHTTPTDAAAAPAAPPAAAPAAPRAPQKLSQDWWPHSVSTLLALRPKLEQTRSAVGFVGLDVHYEATKGSAHSRTVLHNCLGMWWGCVPFQTPALLYHTGHWIMEDLSEPWLAQRLLHSVKDWSSTLGLSHSAAAEDSTTELSKDRLGQLAEPG